MRQQYNEHAFSTTAMANQSVQYPSVTFARHAKMAIAIQHVLKLVLSWFFKSKFGQCGSLAWNFQKIRAFETNFRRAW